MTDNSKTAERVERPVASGELGWGLGQDGCLLFFIVSLLVLLAFKTRVFISLIKK